MITLTTPPQINSVLGSTTTVGYDKLVIGPFTLNPVGSTITGSVRLTSTANAQMQPILGSLTISVPNGLLTVEVVQLDFARQIQLNAGQINSVNTIIANAQNALESGLISLGIMAGTQSGGV